MTFDPRSGPHGPLTPEQGEAVTRPGPLLVTANAGAGKTLVLVERFVREVLDSAAGEDPIGPDGILAITFTRKAAGELRTRVRERFAALGEPDLAREVERAWILTIDGFCLRVLRSHAVLAGLDPGFDVLADAPARELRDAAFAQALERWLGDDAEPRGEALHLLAAHGYDGLHGAITGIYESLRSAGQAEPLVPAVTREDTASAAAALHVAAEEARAELGAIINPGKSVVTALERLATCLDALDAGRVPAPGEVGRWKPGRQGNALKTPVAEACRTAADRYAQALRDATAAPQLALIGELLEGYGAAFDAQKREARALDYTDLALRTRALLLEHPAVAAGLRRRLRRVMVDEFQDTNALQLSLVDALGIDDVFLVGDSLQSIYGFRHADVEVFEAERRRRAQAGQAAALTANFRSRAAILELVNAAFSRAHGDLDWNALTVPAHGGQDACGAPADGPAVELLVTAEAGWDEPALRDRLLSGLPAATRPALAAEALLVAQRVRELVDAGTKAGEIVVLVRAGTQLPLFERAIERAGLPAVAAQGRGWWARLEVLDLIAHLRALANPADEEALLSALAAFAGAAPDMLALLAADRDAQRAGGEQHASLRGALERAVSGAAPGFGEDERGRLQGWLALWERERAAMAWAGPSELLTRVVAATGYAEATLRRPGGARRLANVRKLVRLAREFEARTTGDLRAFVDHAAAELAAKVPTSDAPVEVGADAAVRLMTIHAAKGLEFPVVVVADLGRRPPQDSPRVLVHGNRAGLRVTTMGRERFDGLAFAELKAELVERDRAEERRVLHVAVTRARDRLVLSGVADLAKAGDVADVGKHTAPLRWMAPLLLPGMAPGRLDEISDELLALDSGGHHTELRVAVNAPRTVGTVLRLAGGDEGPVQLAIEGLGATTASEGEPPPGPLLGAGLRSRGDDDLWAGLGDGPAPVAPPPTVSYSALSDYARCPYGWYLRRVLRLPARPAWDLRDVVTPALGDRARLRGTIAHALLERQSLGHPPPSAQQIAAVVAELGAQPLEEGEIADQQTLVRAFLEGPLHARVAAAEWAGREVPFALALDPADRSAPLLTGSIDLLAREPGGGALVVDYKTDHVEPETDIETAVAAAYGLQRAAYALAALRDGALHVDVVHLYLERPQAPVSARYAAQDAAALEAQLLAATSGLLAAEYPVTQTPFAGLCATCPGRHGLCSHPPAMTDRELPVTED